MRWHIEQDDGQPACKTKGKNLLMATIDRVPPKTKYIARSAWCKKCLAIADRNPLIW